MIHETYAWLGLWRDKMPPEAVSRLQEILGPLEIETGDRNQQYILTQSLTRIDFAKPNPDQVNLDDMAYHLAGVPRFSGGTRPRYSVAEHLVICARLVRHRLPRDYPETTIRLIQRATLLHDSEEYIFGDLAAPIKAMCPDYARLATNFRQMILRKYKVDQVYADYLSDIKAIDLKMYRTECVKLRGQVKDDIFDHLRFHCYTPGEAEHAFKEAFNEYA